MKLTIITYDTAHLKTEQTINSLVINREIEISLLIIPFQERLERKVLFQHRPDMSLGMTPDQIIEIYSLQYQRIKSFNDDISFNPDYMLITGAGLIPSNLTKKFKIINVHPGLMPAARGLDAFKWSILRHIPLGVSLHFIDENIDAGELLYYQKTPILKQDTLESLARRHYENEMAVMTNFYHFINKKISLPDLQSLDSTRRMKFEVESLMVKEFEIYKEKFGI